MLQLGAILHSRGFSITVAHTRFNFPNTSNHPDFSFFPLSDGITSPTLFYDDFISFLSLLNATSEAPLRESLLQMAQNQGGQDGKLPCIIYDGLMYFVADVAQSLKLPCIILRTSCAANLLTYDAFPRLRNEGYLPAQDSTSLGFVPGLHPLRFKDLPANSFNLDSLLWFMATVSDTRSSLAIIWNTMDSLERSSLIKIHMQSEVPFFPIGPMHKIVPASSSSLLEEDNNCIPWLDKQAAKTVIYISLGSIAIIDKNELTEMTWGLVNSSQQFLWVIRPGSIQGSSWTELLPDGFREAVGERGCIVKWAPQRKVLAHPAVGGFLSHCGWNSTLENISEGVPMICRPRYGDQRVIARNVTHVWRVGLELGNKLERGEIQQAVQNLMVDKGGEEMRQRVMDLKEKIKLSIAKGGSSYKSLNELVELIASC
ncbi:UDP-glucose iridoid glucosyltransferase [Ricinus communis]|uniref:UDP-glucose iridoid glucosyltransferase n=1 Tax=Ricinus communis TaxID=3988 RepID=UPI00201A2BEF|nr:UDP-glucose iridoid glucosyltransferase [Ricinus communis]